MSSTARVKQSCAPCRQRKTRCNDEQPCASCVLRGTEAECAPASKKPRRERPPRPHSSSDQSMSPRVEDRTRWNETDKGTLSTGMTSQTPEGPNAGYWEKLAEHLPALEVVEILLEFLSQECSWLYYRPHIRDVWKSAIAHRQVSAAEAGSLCMSLAVSALLLGNDKHTLYQPHITPSTLHPRLFQLATEFAGMDTTPPSFEKVQLCVDLYWYSVFVGSVQNIARFIHVGATEAIRIGLLDETDDVWEGLSSSQREERRRAAESVIGSARWLQLGTGIDLLGSVRVNVCQARSVRMGLETPVRLERWDPHQKPVQHPLRILRLHGSAESDRSALYSELFFEMTSFMPRLEGSTIHIGSHPDMESLAKECHTVYREMLSWRTRRIVDANFPMPQASEFQAGNLDQCQALAQALCLHTAFFTISGIALRPWLALSESSSSSTQTTLQMACLTTAREIVHTIPLIKLLVTSRLTPVVTPWLASNLFNAAVTFAIPTLRAVKRYTSASHDDLVSHLPWSLTKPGSHSHSPVIDDARAALDHPGRQLPLEVFGDYDVRRCARDILQILDAMTWLNGSPLGRNAAQRLSELVDKMGLRGGDRTLHSTRSLLADPSADLIGTSHILDWQIASGSPIRSHMQLDPSHIPDPTSHVQPDPIHVQAPFVAPTEAESIVWQGMTQNGNMPSWDATNIGTGTFEDLLQMDPAIWNELFGLPVG